jgi:phosphomannomutase
MLKSSDVLKNSGVAFGTSGARGLVIDFTSEVCAAFTLAFLTSDTSYKRLAIAIDNRPSSPKIAADCIAAAKNMGITVDYYGVIPTPALAVTSMKDNIPAIMVTGSHIPFDRNGLKFYRPDGEITKADEQAILTASVQVPTLAFDDDLPEVSSRAADIYKQRYLSLFDSKLLHCKKIGIYEHSSAGRDLYGDIFEQLGADVISLGRSDHFVPIDTEAVADSDIKQAQAWTTEHNLDAVFSTDGDGDRPLLSDETGTYLRGDILCLLAAKFLKVDGLAVPVSCNSAIESSGYFAQVMRTKIGSPYVIEAFSELVGNSKRIAGFEANGGFLLGSNIDVNEQLLTALPTRDALLPALAVLALAGKNKVSSLLNSLPQCFTASDRLQNFAREKSLALLAKAESDPQAFLVSVGLASGENGSISVAKIDTTDGLRMTLSNNDVVHLRPSGNAPELRCYAESDSQLGAGKLVKRVLGKI